MGIRLITITQQNQLRKGCSRCSTTFTLQDPAISKTRSTGADTSTKLYHLICAREINLTVAEIWWNRLTKYKRKTILMEFDLDPVDIEECYELTYRLLPEEFKIQIDVRYYKK